MNTLTVQRSESIASEPQRPRFSHLLRSEWIKLTSLRTTYFALAAILAAGLSVSLLFAATLESAGLPDEFSVNLVLDGVTMGTLIFGQVIAGILGVLAISSEYSSGTIQHTLTSVPTRLPALGAKALILFAVVTTTAVLTVFGSWAASYPFFAEFGLQANLSTPGFAIALVGASVYLGLCAILGLGLGALLRSATAGAIAIFCATLLAPILTSALPPSVFVQTLRVYLMGHAGDSMARIADASAPFVDLSDQYLSPLGGWITAIVWAGAAFIAGAIALRRRDA